MAPGPDQDRVEIVVSRRGDARRREYQRLGWSTDPDIRGRMFVALAFECEGLPGAQHKRALVERLKRATHDQASDEVLIDGLGRGWIPAVEADAQGRFITLTCRRCDRPPVPVSVDWIEQRLAALAAEHAQWVEHVRL